MKTKIVKLTTEPWTPNPKRNWKVEYNNPLESFEPSKLALHVEPEQKKNFIKGEILAERMKKGGLNSTVLKYLLDHPKLIPENWKKETNGRPTWIFFWGTILLNYEGERYVLYLSWADNRWDWHVWHVLTREWQDNHPSAVLSS